MFSHARTLAPIWFVWAVDDAVELRPSGMCVLGGGRSRWHRDPIAQPGAAHSVFAYSCSRDYPDCSCTPPASPGLACAKAAAFMAADRMMT